MFAQVPPSLAFVLSTPVWVGFALAGAAAGTALLLWGRIAGRAVFLLAGMAAGWWAGTMVAQRLGVNVLAAQIATAVAAGVVAVVLTPFLWAVTAGALIGGAALYFAVLQYQPDLLAKAPTTAQAGGEFDVWSYCLAWCGHLWKCLSSAWDKDTGKVAAVAGLAGGVPLVIGAIRMRLSTIIMSSLCGAWAIVSGLSAAVGLLVPSAATLLQQHWFALVAVGVAIAPVGVVVQYRRVLKADKDQKNREGEPPPPKQDAKM